jgi:hypothetical protein
VSNAAPSTQGLPSVDPIYTWVRLAQRVPVRVGITDVPAGVPLVSGMTVTVTIRDGRAGDSGSWLGQRFADVTSLVENAVYGSKGSPDCVPRAGGEAGTITILPATKPSALSDPTDPGLAPGIDKSPHVQF